MLASAPFDRDVDKQRSALEDTTHWILVYLLSLLAVSGCGGTTAGAIRRVL
jgi:hypothetical protein